MLNYRMKISNKIYELLSDFQFLDFIKVLSLIKFCYIFKIFLKRFILADFSSINSISCILLQLEY